VKLITPSFTPHLHRLNHALAQAAADCYVTAMKTRMRADRLLVERGLFESRAKARAAIEAGGVTADGAPVAKPSVEIAVDAALSAVPAHPWVSRGGVKLSAALDHLGFDPADRVCLDIGASTGGFTEVLLGRGARRVYAVDVGRSQLHSSLRERPEIVSLEATDIRSLDVGQLPERPDFITIDVSFISLKHVLPAALALAAPSPHLVALIKPQFETSGHHLKKGIVRDPAVHATVCDDMAAFLSTLGCEEIALFPSPIAGSDGNREFFVGAQRG
jgi:23S rRNA (cytidine1920-2'-O)/16S rRNA (cytidine1409-2'-O)-methyltransferase